MKAAFLCSCYYTVYTLRRSRGRMIYYCNAMTILIREIETRSLVELGQPLNHRLQRYLLTAHPTDIGPCYVLLRLLVNSLFQYYSTASC